MAQHLIDLQQDDEPDEEAEFDEDETESIGNPNTGDIQNAVRAYLAAPEPSPAAATVSAVCPKDRVPRR